MCSYKDRWAAAVGELLKWSSEPTNVSVRYAMALIKEGMTINHIHVPRTILKVCFIFMTSDGVISGKVTGTRRFSNLAEKIFRTRTIFQSQIFGQVPSENISTTKKGNCGITRKLYKKNSTCIVLRCKVFYCLC